MSSDEPGELGEPRTKHFRATRLGMQGQTRSQILFWGEALLHTHGYVGLSYPEIARHVGINPAGIYHHFKTKDALAMAVMARMHTHFAQWAGQVDAESQNSWTRLEALYAHVLDFLAQRNRLCFVGVLGAEYMDVPGEVVAEIHILMDAVQDWLADVLERGRAEGVLAFDGHLDDKAVQLVCCLQGGVQMARAAGMDRFHQVLDQLREELRPAASGARSA